MVTPSRTPARPSPYIAAGLSFLWPGLGHWYAGRGRAAALFGLPALGILLIVLLESLGGLDQVAVLLITPSSALTILILVALIGIWRLIAITDSLLGFRLRAPWRNPRIASLFTVLVLGVVVMHGYLGYVTWAFYDAGSKIFVGDKGPDATPIPTIAPGASSLPTDDYAATPNATPETKQSAINILLTGIDAAESRDHSLTDTMIVASIDPTTAKVALISFPRDISNFPLWDGRTFHGKINSLMTYARQHPSDFPDGPLPTLVKELSFLIGAPIHYYGAIDLDGFRRMIDIVGGVDVDNPRAINDPAYGWLDGGTGFFLSAGVHHLDGRTALAYVRSRQGLGDSDFTRARRQQQVLLALRQKLTSPAMLTKIPDILGAAGDTIRTNFPSDRIGEMLDLAKQVDNEKTTQVVLGPPYAIHPPSNTTGGVYTLKLDMARLAKLSIDIFGENSAYWQSAQP